MRLKFPLRDPRAPFEPCASEEEFRQRLAAYAAQLLYQVENLAQGATGAAAERFQLDDEAMRDLRGAVSEIFLVLDNAGIAERREARESDGGFQQFMRQAIGPRRRS